MNFSSNRLRLLPRSSLTRTGEFDHADWNYRPALGFVQRARFRLVDSMISGTRVDRMLEVGYGSGVLLPHLERRCSELYGIDIHSFDKDVFEALQACGVTVRLKSASVTKMPFESAFFDAVVTVSALEYVQEIHAACREIKRVLRPGGEFIAVAPMSSPLLDLGLKIIGGEDAGANYGTRRERLLEVLGEHFSIEETRLWPPGVPSGLAIYRGLRLTLPGG